MMQSTHLTVHVSLLPECPFHPDLKEMPLIMCVPCMHVLILLRMC